MILDKLFYQYRTGKKLIWSSKLMNRMGRMFIGTPEHLGLGSLREDIRQQFFLDKVDRLMPKEKSAQKEWARDSNQATQYREVAMPQVSKGTTFAALPLVLVLVAAGMVVDAAKGNKDQTGPAMPTGVGGILGSVTGALGSISDAGISDQQKQQCAQIRSAMAQGMVNRAQVDPKQAKRCGL